MEEGWVRDVDMVNERGRIGSNTSWLINYLDERQRGQRSVVMRLIVYHHPAEWRTSMKLGGGGGWMPGLIQAH